jgi:hypothetical protein
VTVAVQDTLKGPQQRQITFRQFIWDSVDKRTAAGYRKGQALLLFLMKETPEGFTGTAGLNQGRMSISGAPGQAIIQTRTPPAHLFAGVEDALAREKKTLGRSIRTAVRSENANVPLDEFKQAVRDLANLRRSQ